MQLYMLGGSGYQRKGSLVLPSAWYVVGCLLAVVCSRRVRGSNVCGSVGAAVVDEDITEVGLSDYPGKYVILLWYPKDFTYVCPSGATYCHALQVH